MNSNKTCECWEGTPPIPAEDQLLSNVVTDKTTGLVSIHQATANGEDLGELLTLCSHGARALAQQLTAKADAVESERP